MTRQLVFAPGVYDYSGFGEGRLWLPDEQFVKCPPTVASNICLILALPFNRIDRCRNSAGFTRNWRQFVVENDRAGDVLLAAISDARDKGESIPDWLDEVENKVLF